MPIEVINLPIAQRTSTGINTGTNAGTNAGTNEGTALARAQATNNQSSQAESEAEKTPYTDTITFTETATQLQEISSKIAGIPVVNMARVEAMQYRLESGEFRIDTDKLANNILRFETLLQPKQEG